jgi:cytochrome c-type biogenesis protein CcmH
MQLKIEMNIPEKFLYLLLVVVLAALLTSQPAQAQIDTFEFETDEQQQRFRRLSNELRCPLCQNTNLSGSTGGVAEDLRREVHRMIIEGMTDQEIEQFMFERYGDFIFYRPRLRAETVLLWFGPLLFLLIGGFVIYGIVKKSRTVAAASLSEEEYQRIKKLLRQK